MANTLERMDAGGNWTTQNTSSLFSLGQKYPELKKSRQWFAQGFEGLKANLLDNVYPDGPLKEATTGYHGFSVGMFFNVVTSARKMGLDISPQHLRRLEKAFEYSMYSTMPDWQMPAWGDTNRPVDHTGLLKQGAEYFGRQDMLWVATRGREGTKPLQASIEFPIAGYYIMRSGWEPDARYLVTRNGYSNSHFHLDNLSVIVNAYGSDLLPDPGIYTYGTPECNALTQTTSHSTVSVDGKNIVPGNGANTWVSMPGFDCFDGVSPGYHDLRDVRHRRTIVFAKPDYWVVADRITGSGEHTASQYWHFAPGRVEFDPASGIARTANASGGNIAVIPLYPQGLSSEMTKDLYALGWDGVVDDAPVAKHERAGALPLTFCTVLFPYPAGGPADVTATAVTCDDPASGQVVGARVSCAGSVDYVIFGKAGEAVSLNRVASGRPRRRRSSAHHPIVGG
jgi:hypothetical protein